MNIFFLGILFIASCRTQVLPNDANDATKAVDINIDYAAPQNITTGTFDPITYLKENLIPFRRLDDTSITGTGKPKDPFVVKCNEGLVLAQKPNQDRILLIWDESNGGTWKLSNFFHFIPASFSRYSEITIEKQTEPVNTDDLFTCDDPKEPNKNTFNCDISTLNSNPNLNTYGITQILLHKTLKSVFYVSCAKNSQEFGISCKENGEFIDTSYGLTEMEISLEDIEKRCKICPLKDLWQKILPMNMILSLREPEKYLLKCRVNYAKIANKEDLEAKCSDEGEWEVYQLDTESKVEFANVYCEREGCNGYELSGKSSYNESIVMKYTLAVDLDGDGIEEPIEFNH